jgi:hypothetical protein
MTRDSARVDSARHGTQVKSDFTMRFTAVTVGLVLGASPSFAQQHDLNLVVHNYPADHFSISVPAGWVEIPKAELDRITAYARKAAPTPTPQAFKYGFQACRDDPFPRVVIQVETGRWSEESIFKMAGGTKNEEIQRGLNTASPALASMNLQIGSHVWDPKAQIGWMRMQPTEKDGRPMTGLAGLHPTEAGAIKVDCYDYESEFGQFAPTFSAIITSVKIDEQFRYHARSALSRAVELVPVPALTGLVVGGAALLMARALRRRRPGTTRPRGGRAPFLIAVWKLLLGALLLFAQANIVRNALAGNGGLQAGTDSQVHWFVWGLMMYPMVYMIYFGSRDLLGRAGAS